MKKSHPKHIQLLDTLFASKNRKQVAFTSSVVLIGVLFVIAIASILLKKGPSADVVTSPIGRLAKRVSLNNGSLSYTQNGSTKTEPSNSVDIRIKAVPSIDYTLQGLYRADEVSNKLPKPSINVTTTSGAPITAMQATANSGINDTHVKSAFDSDDYRNKVNGTNANLKIKLTVKNYLSRTVTVSDPKSVVVSAPLLGGNFVNTGDSADVIDEADSAKCGPNFNQPVTEANKDCDLNYDGLIDESDTAIWGPNFRQRGSSE